LDDGGFAVGIDGSDYNLRHQRAEWATVPHNLFTADITKPFKLSNNNGGPLTFDAVTMWEVLEHIAPADLAVVLANVKRHLAPGGMLICSIALVADPPYHQTVEAAPWWRDRLARAHLYEDTAARDFFHPDWVRGWDTDARSSYCTACAQTEDPGR
jgi:2-polyprenyl-3-methyl-5-hydroxy-6-metoxy-1,4-benzoquinol methylase